MYVVSFRIPFYKFGKLMYFNGSCLSKRCYQKDQVIAVSKKNDMERSSFDGGPPVHACYVIECNQTGKKEEAFDWRLFK